MRLHRATILLLALLPACAGGAPRSEPPAPAPVPASVAERATASPPSSDALRAAAATITPDDVYRHIAFLASDELRGRDTPSPGLDRAAEYIAEQFRSFGLEPGADGDFIQRWPFREVSLDPERLSVRIAAGGETTTAAHRRDFFLMPSPSDSVSGELVYAGTAAPGVTVPPDAAGKVAVFFMPGADVSQEWGLAISSALGAAIGARAAAAIIVVDPGFDPGMFAAMSGQVAAQMAPIPLLGFTHSAASAALARAGADLDALSAAAPGQLVPIDASVTIRAAQAESETTVPNVVAVLPGSDPELRDTYVVFSAHIDHVGVGAPDARGDSIYNGADDDASGTSTLLEVAEAFASLEARPARSLLFLGVSGEEKGLLGSAYYVDHPTVPLESMVANVNLDMVGRNAPDSVVAIGQDYTTLGDLVQRVARDNADLGITVAPDLWPEEQLFFRSDHFSFAKKGVPAIFFTTGLHDDYHRPSDEVDTIDTDKVARVARLVFYLGHAIATNPEPPEWTEKGRTEVGAMSRN